MRVNLVTHFYAYFIAYCQWQYGRHLLIGKITQRILTIISLHNTITLLIVILLLAWLLKKTVEEEQCPRQLIDT